MKHILLVFVLASCAASAAIVVVAPSEEGGGGGGDHAYFDTLAARGDVVHAIAFRSQEDVDIYEAPANDAIDYDATVDSMRATWPDPGGGNNISQMQVGISPSISSGNVFVTWEERWSSEWAADGGGGSVNGINTHKNYQYSDADPYSSGGLQLEVRMGHTKAPIADTNVPAGDVGYVNIRTYFVPSELRCSGDSLCGIQNDVLVGAETWHRYFLFVEYVDNGKVSLWVTNKSGTPINVYSQAVGDGSGDPGPFLSWWFEHNSSQTYDGPTSHIWNRNLVILDGVADLTAAQALVDDGSLE